MEKCVYVCDTCDKHSEPVTRTHFTRRTPEVAPGFLEVVINSRCIVICETCASEPFLKVIQESFKPDSNPQD